MLNKKQNTNLSILIKKFKQFLNLAEEDIYFNMARKPWPVCFNNNLDLFKLNISIKSKTNQECLNKLPRYSCTR